MKKLTKLSSILIMAILGATACIAGLCINSAKADALSDIENFNFTAQNTVQIQVGMSKNGYSQEDYAMRFYAKSEKEEYESFINEHKGFARFGMVILSSDMAKGQKIDEQSIIVNKEGVFFKNNNGQLKEVPYVESSTLNAYEVNEKIEFYYLPIAIDGENIEYRDTEFFAVSYVKLINKDGSTIYDVKDCDINSAISPAYAAQLKMEEYQLADDMRKAIKEAYTKSVVDSVVIEYSVSYDGDKSDIERRTCLFSIGTNLTVESAKNKLYSLDVISGYELEEGVITVNGQEVEGAIVYANGKTDADVSLSFKAERADETCYDAFSGYYSTEEFASIIFKDKTVIINADRTFGEQVVACDYVLYSDGTIKYVNGEEIYFGKYDLENKTVSIKIDNKTYTYSANAELSKDAYENLSGFYTDGNDIYLLNVDGTLSKNLIAEGYYLLGYNEESEQMEIYANFYNGETYSSELNYVDGNGFTFNFDDKTFVKDKENVMANKSAYKNLAKTYEFVRSSDGAKSILTLNENGSLTFKGIDGYAKNTGLAIKGVAVLSDIKYGKFVLFEDNSLKLYIPQMVKENEVSNFVVDATFNGTDAVVLQNQKYTAVESIVDNENNQEIKIDTQKLYDAVAGKEFYSETKLWENNEPYFGLEFYSYKEEEGFYKFRFISNTGIFFKYEFKPITENFGKLESFCYNESSNKYYYGLSAGDIYYYYDGENVYFRFSNNSESKRFGSYIPYNHFVDLLLDPKTYNIGVEFDKLASDSVGYTVYDDGKASLTLNKKEKIFAFDKDGNQTETKFTGGTAIFNDGINGNIDATYNLVKVDEESGYIFFDLSKTPQYYANREDKSAFVSGEYYLYNGKYVIDFVYNGQRFILVDGGMDKIVLKNMAGLYSGTQGELVVNSDGTLSFGGKTATCMVEPIDFNNGILTVMVENEVLVGKYFAEKGAEKIYIGNNSFIKIKSIENLFGEYAGTYNATYMVEGATNTMKLVLNADGTFVGTGTSSANDQVVNFLNNEIKVYNKHLGEAERRGTYSFETIDGEIKIVFNFNLENQAVDFVYANENYKQAINANSGYYSEIIYTDLWINSSTVTALSYYEVYSYAVGALGEGSLSVMFNSFSDQPILLVKA